MQEEIENLIKRHEEFKSKFQDLTPLDLFEWLRLKEEMLDLFVEWSSLYSEEKIDLDNKKGSRVIFLKWELDFQWKKKYTESSINSIINKEFQEEDKKLNQIKKNITLIKNKADTIIEYINISKNILV